MVITPASLARAVLTTGSTTLYAVPSATTTIITNIVLANTSTAAATATIDVDGVTLVPTISIGANTIITIDIRQPLAATKLITGFAGTASAISCHIAGVEQT